MSLANFFKVVTCIYLCVYRNIYFIFCTNDIGKNKIPPRLPPVGPRLIRGWSAIVPFPGTFILINTRVGLWLGFLPKIQSHLLVIREWFILHVLVDRSVYSYAMVCIPTTYEAYEKSTPLRYPVADIDSSIARFFLCPSWRFNVPGYDMF